MLSKLILVALTIFSATAEAGYDGYLFQPANKILAGPTSGGSGTAVFRSLVGADLPNPSSSTLGGIESYASVSHQFINAISTSGVPSSAQPAFSDLSGNITAAQMLALPSGDFYVGNGSNQPAAVAMSGDATLANTGAVTLASSGVTAGTYDGPYTVDAKGRVTSASNGSTSAIGGTSIDWSIAATLYTKTLGANTTFTFSNAVSGQTIVVRLTNTASNYTVTWPTVKWAGGTAPTMTVGAKSDVYTFIYDGTDYFGSYVQDMH